MIDLREWATQTIIHLVWRKRESRGRERRGGRGGEREEGRERRGERDGVRGEGRRERGRERWSIGNVREKKRRRYKKTEGRRRREMKE